MVADGVISRDSMQVQTLIGLDRIITGGLNAARYHTNRTVGGKKNEGSVCE